MKSLYEKTIAFVLQYMDEHKLGAGDQLPTEAQLSSLAGVSLVTVRRALSELAAQGLYASISARGLVAGSGYHMMATDQIERYRAAVAEDVTGEELRRVIAEVVAGSGAEVIGENQLKTVPRGFTAFQSCCAPGLNASRSSSSRLR